MVGGLHGAPGHAWAVSPPPAVNADAAAGRPAGDGRAPEMVAAPAHPGVPGSDELLLEARPLPGHGKVLPVFSTVGKLVAALGQSQPWAVLPLERAREMAAAAGVELVALDPVMSPETWQWGPQDLDDFEQGRRMS